MLNEKNVLCNKITQFRLNCIRDYESGFELCVHQNVDRYENQTVSQCSRDENAKNRRVNCLKETK